MEERALEIKVIREGMGSLPKIGQKVRAHYELYFGEGSSSSDYDYDKEKYVDSLYDSTYEDKPFNGPVEFVIGQETPKDEVYTKGDSIRGLDQAFFTMKVGGKVDLFIPSELAYGEEGASSFHTFFGYRVPPFRDLRGTLELVEIEEDPDTQDKPNRGPAYEG